MKAILHIGTEKTGTQSIQEFLFRNRRELMASGYYFPQSTGQRNCRSIVAYCLDVQKNDEYFKVRNIHSLEEKHEFRHDFERRFNNEMLSVPKDTHTVIFSSEHFHSRIRTQQEVERVRALLAPYFNEFKIICYLREQSACCTSSYSTAIKSGGIVSLNEFLKNCVPENHYYNYNTMLSIWMNFFGFSILDVSLFDSTRYLNHNLLDDFTAKLEPGLVGTLNTNLPVKNKSLSYTGQVVGKIISRLLPPDPKNGQRSTLSKKCLKLVSRQLTGQGEHPSLIQKKEIHDAFKASNEEVRKKYFPDLAELFQSPA